MIQRQRGIYILVFLKIKENNRLATELVDYGNIIPGSLNPSIEGHRVQSSILGFLRQRGPETKKIVSKTGGLASASSPFLICGKNQVATVRHS